MSSVSNAIMQTNQYRRFLLKSAVASAGAMLAPSVAWTQSNQLRIGTTPVFLDDQQGFLNAWRQFLRDRLGMPVVFVQKSNYRQILDLLLDGSIDCAWLCGYPYVRFRDRLQLLAVPTYRRAPLYESYLIVPADDNATPNLLSMKGRTFAFSDPLSNSGYLVPRYMLWENGTDTERHFSRTLFTWSHKKVVQAVSVGLVDGGAVDGYVWETLAKLSPHLTRATRVAWKSPNYGFPPIVASRAMPADKLAAVRQVLTSMADDQTGQALLTQLNLDGFIQADSDLFAPIAQMMHSLQRAGESL